MVYQLIFIVCSAMDTKLNYCKSHSCNVYDIVYNIIYILLFVTTNSIVNNNDSHSHLNLAGNEMVSFDSYRLKVQDL